MPSAGPARTVELVADPNLVPGGPGTGTTTLSWNAGDREDIHLYVTRNGSGERHLAAGSTGSFQAPWIRDNTIYEFRLYQESEQRSVFGLRREAKDRVLLARTLVTRGDLIWNLAYDGFIQQASKPEHTDRAARLLAKGMRRYLRADVYRKYFRFWQEQGFHFTHVHFYSPIPDTRTLGEDLWTQDSQLPGINLNEALQLRLLCEVFPAFRQEYEKIPTAPADPPYLFHLNNNLFDGTDALALYCLVRHFQPKLVMEVGSGFSSRLCAQAALLNGNTRLVCIEPYPDPVLKKGFPGLTALLESPVQNIPLERFQELEANDILFIDSSHVVRVGGDVNYLFLEVLPRLKPGVIVHVHDIFFPQPYRRDWVMDEFRFWTEQFLLQAFLVFNSEFEVLLSNNYLGRKYLPEMKATFPNAPWWGGGSFWMRRKTSG